MSMLFGVDEILESAADIGYARCVGKNVPKEITEEKVELEF